MPVHIVCMKGKLFQLFYPTQKDSSITTDSECLLPKSYRGTTSRGRESQETFCNSQTGKVLGIFPIIGKWLGQHFPLMGTIGKSLGLFLPMLGSLWEMKQNIF